MILLSEPIEPGLRKNLVISDITKDMSVDISVGDTMELRACWRFRKDQKQAKQFYSELDADWRDKL